MRFFALVAALCLAPAARAGEVLTYGEAMDMALQANPALYAAIVAKEQAEADVIAAHAEYDPQLSLNGGYSQTDSLQFNPPLPDAYESRSQSWNAGATLSARSPTGTSGTFSSRFFENYSEFEGFTSDVVEQRYFQPEFRFELSQELLKGLLLSYNLQNVRTNVEARKRADLELEQARQQALADAAGGYWNWVYLWALARISDRSVEVAEENLRVGLARVDAGEAAPVEKTRLEAALVQARSGAIEAHNNAADALDQLLILLGQSPGRELEPGTLPRDVPSLDVDVGKAVEVAVQGSYDLAIARSRLETAQLELTAARSNTWPTLTANASAGVRGGNPSSWGDAFEFLGQFPFFEVGGAFSVPLGSRAARGRLQRAESATALARRQLTDQESQVRASAATQVRVLRSAATKVELADANVRLARETLEAEQARYEAGRALLKDVLEAQQELERAEGEAVKARTDFRRAEVELRRLQGTLDASMI